MCSLDESATIDKYDGIFVYGEKLCEVTLSGLIPTCRDVRRPPKPLFVKLLAGTVVGETR